MLPETRQFDFWLGDWDVTWGENERGSNHVEAIMDGHVILENFDGSPSLPLRGMSLSAYNAKINKWQQTWVDNEGSYWSFSGDYKEDRMILTTEDLEQGKRIDLRMIFYNIKPDEFDWRWEKSLDTGKTWSLKWQLHYQRRRD